ncbi:MAG: hypothetical protein J1G06_01445 [Oscillospiraceae bacterium]|nr:hypothetical protein [Oscillospiraceae bacterium]
MKLFKRFLSAAIALVMAMSLMPTLALADDGPIFSGGDGTADNPYQISNVKDLTDLAEAVNGGETYSGKHFELTDDINLGGESMPWTPIGQDTESKQDDFQGFKFSGIFDGANHKITGLYINSQKDYQGLFGYIEKNGIIQNLSVDGSVSGENYVGVIVGYSRGKILKCYNSGTVSGIRNSSNLGGIVGMNDGGTISDCYNTGKITSYGNAGGIAGQNKQGIISNCYNIGELIGEGYAGGIVGWNHTDSTISDCHNDGPVISRERYSYAGGIAGSNALNSAISNCYNTGTVESNSTISYAGGIAGDNGEKCKIENCYNNGSVICTTSDYGYGGVGGIAGQNYSPLVSNCYNTGAISSSGASGALLYVGGIVGYNAENEQYGATTTNCYYLEGTADGGINGEDNLGKAEVRDETAFASGEVAWLLQNNADPAQSGLVWGQQIITGQTDDYPIFASEEAERVFKIDCSTLNDVILATKYTNTDGSIVLPDESDLPETLQGNFSHWTFDKKDADKNFTNETQLNKTLAPIKDSMTVYALPKFDVKIDVIADHGTGKYADTIATGFLADITTYAETASISKLLFTVTANEKIADTDTFEKDVNIKPEITISRGAGIIMGFVIDQIFDEDADVTLKVVE